MTLVLYYLQHI